MEAVAIVTVLALVQYCYFGVQVGSVRGKKGIKAPAQSGDEEFERMNRVHLNTLEQLIVMLPAMWMFAHFINPLWAAGAGVIFIIGRFIYRSAYLKDPGSRTIGFVMSYLPGIVMLIWVLIKALLSYI
ncbi:MAG: MAPEG family protein [Gammaproteobacteria bacterium]|nr:MAPEG family protein [Gammaproteobacteria bacterium]